MQIFNIESEMAVRVQDSGNFEFIHLVNISDSTLYICYDGELGNGDENDNVNQFQQDHSGDGYQLGVPLLAGQTLMLNNDGVKQIFKHPIWVVQHSGGDDKKVLVMGGDKAGNI